MELIKESLAQGDKMLIFRFVIIKLEIREKNGRTNNTTKASSSSRTNVVNL